ncbi:MAG: hypothetical protein H0V01_00660 [Bacteroidetes bacterium]|nr:hypothetical protein [Bacteroidota bacterium]HET6243389.1 hypothetical protein [Bacteroidia bacterium]
MIKTSTIALIMACTFFSCKSGKIADKSNKPLHEKVIVEPDFSKQGKNTRMQIQEVKLISDKTIEISFSYSGGCKEHSFSLYTSGALIKTLPPKIHLFLVNHQQEDACRELITAKIQFDISNALPSNTKKTILIFNDVFEYALEI